MKNKKRDGRGRDVPTHQKPKIKPKEPEETLKQLIEKTLYKAVNNFNHQSSM